MMNIFYAALIGILCGGVAGYAYRDNAVERAQVNILKSDAIELPKVEAKNDERKAKIVTIVKTITEKAKPGDCLLSDMSDDTLAGLRAGGITTGF